MGVFIQDIYNKIRIMRLDRLSIECGRLANTRFKTGIFRATSEF